VPASGVVLKRIAGWGRAAPAQAAATAIATAGVSLVIPAALGGLVNVLAQAVARPGAPTDAPVTLLARLAGQPSINAAAARLLGLFLLNSMAHARAGTRGPLGCL
jgi:hypothetical protein